MRGLAIIIDWRRIEFGYYPKVAEAVAAARQWGMGRPDSTLIRADYVEKVM